MPGNIFHYYIRDANKKNGENKVEAQKEYKRVSRYDIEEVKPTVGTKILTYLKNETFMDLIT